MNFEKNNICQSHNNSAINSEVGFENNKKDNQNVLKNKVSSEVSKIFDLNQLASSIQESNKSNLSKDFHDKYDFNQNNFDYKNYSKKLYNLDEGLSYNPDELKDILEKLHSADTFYVDLDQTLAESKYEITPFMAQMLKQILDTKNIVIVTGGLFETVKKNVIDQLDSDTNFENLIILPIVGNETFKYDKNTNQYNLVNEVQRSIISPEESVIIESAIENMLYEFGHPNEGLHNSGNGKIEKFPNKLEFSDLIERRGSNGIIKDISFAYFGQNVPKSEKGFKNNWDKDKSKRFEMVKLIEKILPESIKKSISLEVGGSTTIDFVKQGCDKGNSINEFRKVNGLENEKAICLGDSFKRGNDRPMMTGTDLYGISVENRKQTEVLFALLTNNYAG